MWYVVELYYYLAFLPIEAPDMASIYKRSWLNKDGKTRIAWVCGYKDQHGKRHNRQFTTKREAKDFAILAGGEVVAGTHVPESTSITVAQAAELWLQRGERNGLERSTMRSYKGQVEQYLLPLIGAVKLAKLSTPTVVAFTDHLLAAGHSRDRARRVVGVLKAILAEAQRAGLVTVNAATPVRITISRRDDEPVQIPQPAEVAALIDGASGWVRPFLLVAALCGLRASELRGLPWSAVDFDKRTLTVRQRADEWGQIGPPKSAAGRREVPLAPVALNALREWKLACPKGPLGLVFPTRTGAVQRHSNIAGRHWGPLQRQVLGSERYGLHTLRHYFASWIIASGFSPKRAQVLLGHSSVQMTFDRYGHLFPSVEDDHARFAEGERMVVVNGHRLSSRYQQSDTS